MLNKFIKINDRNPVPAFVFEEHLQFPQFIERSHVSQNQIQISIIPSNWGVQINRLVNRKKTKKSNYRVGSICEAKASRFGAPTASERSTWGLLGDCSRPETVEILKRLGYDRDFQERLGLEWRVRGVPERGACKRRCVEYRRSLRRAISLRPRCCLTSSSSLSSSVTALDRTC